MQYLVTFQSHTGRQAETIEADSHSREAGGTSIVFRAVQRVAFTDREVVVRRLDAADVDTTRPSGLSVSATRGGR